MKDLNAIPGPNIERECHLKMPPIGGRVDDYLVPLQVGASYAFPVRIEDYWCPATKEIPLKLKPGAYRVAAKLVSEKPSRVNGDMAGIRVLNVWTGTLTSDAKTANLR